MDFASPDRQPNIPQDRNTPEFLGNADHPHDVRLGRRNGGRGLPVHLERLLRVLELRRLSMQYSHAPAKAGFRSLMPQLTNFIMNAPVK
jgi:hypothetical protein